MYSMRSWTVLGVLSVLLLSTASPILFTSAQEPIRSIHIEPLQYVTPDVIVTLNNSVNSSFETMVGIDDSVDEEVFVELDTILDMDWPTTIVPQTLNFTSPGSQKVNITITVPAGSDASVVAVVKLLGYAHFPDEDTMASVSGYLYLKQTFGIALNYTYTKRDPQDTRIEVRILNSGNGMDTFEVRLLDGDKIDDAGLSVLLSNNALQASPNNWYTCNVHVGYDGSKFPLKFNLRIIVMSFGSQQKGPVVQNIIVIPLSFKGPDAPLQPRVFVGVIVAFVIVVVIILAVVLRGPAKKPR